MLGLNLPFRDGGTVVFVAALSVLGVLAVAPSWADGDGNSYMGLATGVRCRPGRCGVGAHSEARPQGARRPGVSPPRQTGTGGARSTGPPVVESSGWDFDLGGGMGVLPRFDGAGPKPKDDGGAGPDFVAGP